VLETRDEVSWLADGTGLLCPLLEKHDLPTATCRSGDSAIERLERAGVMTTRPLLAHVNYIDDEDLDRLRSSDATVVWCPRSHDFFGHEPHRWRDMMAAGINVCVGTDSLASNKTLSVLDELRFVRQQAPDFSADALLEMGTIRAARGLGLDSQVGSLRPGKYADFVCIPWDPAGPESPAANLLDGGQNAHAVWIGGERIIGMQEE
ncbi:MAG: amidohydrolase family protein, partial [Planctomycetota bacterium]